MLFLRNLDAATIAAILVALVVGITFHEFSHAFVADQLGDHRPRALGRVSLNPADHIDPMGALTFVLVGGELAPRFAQLGAGRLCPLALDDSGLHSNHLRKRPEGDAFAIRQAATPAPPDEVH